MALACLQFLQSKAFGKAFPMYKKMHEYYFLVVCISSFGMTDPDLCALILNVRCCVNAIFWVKSMPFSQGIICSQVATMLKCEKGWSSYVKCVNIKKNLKACI